MRVSARPRRLACTPGTASEIVVEVVNELAVIDGITAVVTSGAAGSAPTGADALASEVLAGADGLAGLDVVAAPALLPLFPGTAGTLRLKFTPSATFAAGLHDLLIEVRSSVEPSTSHTVAVSLDVAPRPHATLAVLPPSREARHRATYDLVVDNPGNTTLEVAVAASDGDRALRTKVEPPSVLVGPGQSARATMAVRGRRKVYGTTPRHTLAVVGTATGVDVEARADFRIKPLVPSGVRTLLVLGLIVAVWAGIFVAALTKAYSNDPLTKDVPPSFYSASPAAKTSVGRSALGALGTFKFETAASDTASTGDPAGAVPKAGVAIGIGGTVKGTVDAASTSAPIGRITVEAVRATPDGPSLVSSAATGTDGTYVLSGLLPGDYFLHFTATGYRDVWYPAAASQAAATPVTVDALADTTGIDATIAGLPATITGSVVTGADSPVPVTVTVEPGQGATTPIATVTTAADGTYTIPNLPAPGTYDLSFTAPGYSVASDTEDVAGGEQHAANTVDLSAGSGSISGTVTGTGSAPLGGVTVTATANGRTFTTATPTTGAVGAFTLADLPSPATYLLSFTAPGYGTSSVAQPLGPGQALTGLAVSMAGGAGTVSGTVTDASAARTPLGGVTITVNGGPAPVTTQSLTAATSPNFTLSGLPPGSYTLTFSLAGYQSQTIGATLTATGAVTGLSVALSPAAGGVAGTVTGSPPSATATGCDANRTGVAAAALGGVAITATDGATTVSTSTTTSPAGHYALSGLGAGSWTLTFTATGCAPYTALVQVGPGATAAGDVTLHPGGR